MTQAASPDRIEFASRGYAALQRGDVDAVLAEMSPEVEWRNPDEAIEGGTRRGREDVKVALQALLDTFEDMNIEIADSAEVGEATALLVRSRGRGRTSGAPLDQLFGHVFRFAGDVPVAFEWYGEPRDALAAIGAPEWAGGVSGGS